MFKHRSSNVRFTGLAALSLAGSVLLSGCGLNGGGSTTTAAATGVATGASKPGGFGGIVHGGQQAVSGATVVLWAAGTTGTYGTAATQLATTTTDGSGSFTLNTSPTASITAYAVDGSGNATFTAANSFVVGNVVTLSGFSTSTFFNGTTVTVTSATATQFQGTVATADENLSASESGTGTAVAQGGSPCATGQYLYLTATGGNAGGGTNKSLGLMAALPTPCVTGTGTGTTASTSVFIDEVTTVAAVTALQQFMSINTSFTPPYAGTGNVPWTIGAPSTNVTGLANAFLQTGVLANPTIGTSANNFPSNTVTPNNATTSQLFTTSALPEFNKINGLADILATCVNDTTGNMCTGSAGVLTLTTIGTGTSAPTYVVPADTIQAAYNMATLPNAALTSSSGSKYFWKNSTGTATYLSTLWSNISSQAPFQPYYATTPPDTAVGVSWKTTGPVSGSVGTVYAASVAIDGKGNIWVGGGSGVTSNYITQFNQGGQLLQDIVTANFPSYTFSFYGDSTTATTATTTANATQALGYGRPLQSIAIDTNNNAWFNAYSATSPGTIAGEITGITAEVTQSGTATAYLTGSSDGTLVIDPSNNLFMSDIPTSGRYYLSMVSSASSYMSAYEGVGRSTGIYNGLAVDANGYVWGFNSSCTTPLTIQRVNAAGEVATNGTTNEANVTSPYCAYQGAGDSNGNMWTTDGTNLDYINISSSLTTPTANVAFTGGSGTGLLSVNALAVDGAGNVWAINKGTTTTAGSAGVAEFATSGTTGAVTLLSPASATAEGFGSTIGVYLGGPEGIALDGSGNVWFATTGGSYLYYLVGIAAPTRTPLSAAYSHIGTKP